MKISFVIPAYNEERRLGTAIGSIQSELRAHPEIEAEIIVANNASTDRTREVALGFAGVRVVDEPRKGVVRARQCGLVEARGELVAHIDADNELMPGWLALALEEFARDARLVCLSGPYIYRDVPGRVQFIAYLFYRVSFVIGAILTFLLGKGTVVMGGNYVVRKQAVLDTGGYNTDIEFYGDDTDVSRQLSAVGRVRFRFGLKVWSSGRRLLEHGVLRTGARYAINYFWVLFFKRPHDRHAPELTER